MINNNNNFDKLIHNNEVYTKGYYNGEVVFGETPVREEFILTIKATETSGTFAWLVPYDSGYSNYNYTFEGVTVTGAINAHSQRMVHFSDKSIGEEMEIVFTGTLQTIQLLGDLNTNKIGCDLVSVNFGSIIAFRTFLEMFNECRFLTKVNFNGINLSTFKRATDSARVMTRMFRNCIRLDNVDFTAFYDSRPRNLLSFFINGISLVNLNMNGFDTSQLTNLNDALRFNTKINLLTSGIQNWSVPRLTSGARFLNNAPDTEDNTTFLDQLYNNWATTLPTRTTSSPLDFGFIKYTSASATARQIILNKRWVLTDGGLQQ